MTTATPEKADGLKALQEAIEEIEKTIKSMGGVFQIQMAVSTYILFFLIGELILKCYLPNVKN